MTTDKMTEKPSELLPCRDVPDTHVWSDDYKEFDGGRTVTRYCTKCGLTAMEHTMRIF